MLLLAVSHTDTRTWLFQQTFREDVTNLRRMRTKTLAFIHLTTYEYNRQSIHCHALKRTNISHKLLISLLSDILATTVPYIELHDMDQFLQL